MSRIGKKPIPLPSGVNYAVQGNLIVVEGSQIDATRAGGASHLGHDGQPRVVTIQAIGSKGADHEDWSDPVS